MPDGLSQLRAGLEAFEETLESFTGPLVEEHAGLRLMAEALRERRDHIERQIAKQQVAALELRFAGPAVPAALVAAVIGGLQEALHAVGGSLVGRASEVDPALRAAELTLQLDPAGAEQGAIRLRRHEGPRAGLLVEPGADEPLVERAMQRLVEVLDGDADGSALRALGTAVLGSGVVVTVDVTTPLGRAEARVDQVRAQQLAGGA